MSKKLRQYRTKIVPQMRRLFFRQNVLNERRKPDGFQANLVQYDGKYASKTGA